MSLVVDNFGKLWQTSPMAKGRPVPWAEVGGRLAQRIFDELLWTKAEAIRRSGVSGKTLDGYLAGAPIKRRDKKRELCRAIGWTSDSIDRLRRGEEPVELEDWTPDSIDRILDGGEPVEAMPAKPVDPKSDAGLRARVEALERLVERQQAEIVELRRRPAG